MQLVAKTKLKNLLVSVDADEKKKNKEKISKANMATSTHAASTRRVNTDDTVTRQGREIFELPFFSNDPLSEAFRSKEFTARPGGACSAANDATRRLTTRNRLVQRHLLEDVGDDFLTSIPERRQNRFFFQENLDRRLRACLGGQPDDSPHPEEFGDQRLLCALSRLPEFEAFSRCLRNYSIHLERTIAGEDEEEEEENSYPANIAVLVDTIIYYSNRTLATPDPRWHRLQMSLFFDAVVATQQEESTSGHSSERSQRLMLPTATSSLDGHTSPSYCRVSIPCSFSSAIDKCAPQVADRAASRARLLDQQRKKRSLPSCFSMYHTLLRLGQVDNKRFSEWQRMRPRDSHRRALKVHVRLGSRHTSRRSNRLVEAHRQAPG